MSPLSIRGAQFLHRSSMYRPIPRRCPWRRQALTPTCIGEAPECTLPAPRDQPKNTLMRTVILAGGMGTRLSEETAARPKPMVEIGGMPILWHIMKIYATHGFKDFLVACGYKGECIKEYFHNFAARTNDCFIDLKTGNREVV